MKALRHLLFHLGVAMPVVYGAIHNLFVGNLFTPAAIYALEFNDETNNFRIVQNHTADASHAWITFDHDKKNIYATSLNKSRIASYSVKNATAIELIKTIPASGACLNTTSAFISAMPTAPYYAFSGSWPGPRACGMSFSVDSDGTLSGVLDSWSYANTSGIHGLALSPLAAAAATPNEQLVYSADLNGDAIWTHAINLTTGLARPSSQFPMPFSGMHPRHLAAHPSGRYLYAVMEADNSLAQFSLSPTAAGNITAETARHMLIPTETNTTDFWSAEVMLSPSARYLWATARAKTNETTGFISVFLLAEDGAVLRRMFRVPTTTLGGWANAIAPAPWSDEYAVMTDYPLGYVQVWKLEGGRERTEDGGGRVREYTGAKPVARVDVGDGGCCANAIWYS